MKVLLISSTLLLASLNAFSVTYFVNAEISVANSDERQACEAATRKALEALDVKCKKLWGRRDVVKVELDLSVNRCTAKATSNCINVAF